MQAIHDASYADVVRAEYREMGRGEKTPSEPGTSSPLAMTRFSDVQAARLT